MLGRLCECVQGSRKVRVCNSHTRPDTCALINNNVQLKCALPENLHRFLFFLFYHGDRSFMFLVMFGNFCGMQVMPLPEAALLGRQSRWGTQSG